MNKTLITALLISAGGIFLGQLAYDQYRQWRLNSEVAK